jgi:hypothetical protein
MVRRNVLFASSLLAIGLADAQNPEPSEKTMHRAPEERAGSPESEAAHFVLCQSFFQQGDFEGLLKAADAGLKIFPESARLNLLKVSALERQGRTYLARQTLSKAAQSLDDVALLRYSAEVEDRFGGPAASIYAKLVEKMKASGSPQEAITKAATRGRLVSLREGDLERTAWFERQLFTRGNKTGRSSQMAETARNTILLPGGRDALAFIARGKAGSSPERFLADYCRAVLNFTENSGSAASKIYLDAIREYFENLSALLQEAEHKDDRAVVTLSLVDQAAQRRTEKVLDFFGWRLKIAGKQLTIESGVKVAQAKRQEIATALAIDQVEMQESLKAGKPFQIKVPLEQIPVTLTEAQWLAASKVKGKLAGGLAEEFAMDPNLARTYVGVSSLDSGTAKVLIDAIGLRVLVERYGGPMKDFGSSLTVSGNRVVVPGGTTGEAAWAKLVGVSPSDAVAFLRALFDKDNGSQLKYFAALSELDSRHQAFLTRGTSRIQRFYEVYRESFDARGRVQGLQEVSFTDFIRGIPLNDDESVDFPGSAGVWWVINGKSNSQSNTDKLIKKARETAAPDVEDEILLRLARTRFIAANQVFSEADKFIAVVRIDQHRKAEGSDPLDDPSAILLAQNFLQFGNLYPYFSTLTALTYPDFQKVFALAEHLKGQNQYELNQVLGQFDSALELLSLAVQAETLSQKSSADLLVQYCDGLAKAQSLADFSGASLNFLRSLVSKAPKGMNADAFLRGMILGTTVDVEFQTKGIARNFNASKAQTADFERVMDLQKVPSVQILLDAADAAGAIARGTGSAKEQLKVLDESLAGITFVELPKGVTPEWREKTNLKSGQLQRVQSIATQLRERAGKDKVNPKELERLNGELLSELAPQLRLAMSGLIYARYFRPTDLLIADDPLFLRKHQFVSVGEALTRHALFPASNLSMSIDKTGSSIAGCFAYFSETVGRAVLSGATKADSNGDEVVAAQIGSLRDTNWSLFQDGDQQVAALRIRIAREWCVEASLQPKLRDELAAETMGLISISRRRDLLSGISSGDWKTVWSSLTLSDLYFLGTRYSLRYDTDQWASPVSVALRQQTGNIKMSHLQLLGADHKYLSACGHPHLAEFSPYEEYEHQPYPGKLAERVAEWKLYLAEYFDRAGLPAQGISLIAEPAAKRLLRDVNMADLRDWNSVLAAYSKLTGEIVEGVLPR